jgi:hypothetical protein
MPSKWRARPDLLLRLNEKGPGAIRGLFCRARHIKAPLGSSKSDPAAHFSQGCVPPSPCLKRPFQRFHGREVRRRHQSVAKDGKLLQEVTRAESNYARHHTNK